MNIFRFVLFILSCCSFSFCMKQEEPPVKQSIEQYSSGYNSDSTLKIFVSTLQKKDLYFIPREIITL